MKMVWIGRPLAIGHNGILWELWVWNILIDSDFMQAECYVEGGG